MGGQMTKIHLEEFDYRVLDAIIEGCSTRIDIGEHIGSNSYARLTRSINRLIALGKIERIIGKKPFQFRGIDTHPSNPQEGSIEEQKPSESEEGKKELIGDDQTNSYGGLQPDEHIVIDRKGKLNRLIIEVDEGGRKTTLIFN